MHGSDLPVSLTPLTLAVIRAVGARLEKEDRYWCDILVVRYLKILM